MHRREGRGRTRSDLGGSVTPRRRARAFPGGSERHWGVLGRESSEDGWNEVRQEGGQWPGQVHLGGFRDEAGTAELRRAGSGEGQRPVGCGARDGCRVCGARAHADAIQNTDVQRRDEKGTKM